MSLSRSVSIHCSKCGKPLEATIFESVNSDYAADLAMQIMSGELFDITCPHCDFVSHLEYDFLYHDIKNGAMIWVVHKASQNYASKIAEIRATPKLQYKTLRIVENMTELKEKVSCLERKWDDRIIELCKVFSVGSLLSHRPDFDVQRVFYTAISGKDMLYLYDFDGKEMFCELPGTTYDYLHDLYFSSTYAAQFNDNYPIVDYTWAEKMLMLLLQPEADKATVDTEVSIETHVPIACDPKVTCPVCNSVLPDDSEFCHYCGSKVSVVCEEPPIAEAPELPTLPPEPETPITGEEEVSTDNAISFCLDDETGLVPGKPIYTDGQDQAQCYLQSLRSIDGNVLKWNCRGSVKVDGIQGFVDIYDAYLPSGAEHKTIFINTNGSSEPTYAPKGFSYMSTRSSAIDKKQQRNKSYPSKRRRTLKALIIIVVIAIILAIAVVIGLLEYRYQLAHQDLENKNYDFAYAAFQELGSYRDSEAMLSTVLEEKYKKLKQDMRSVNGDNYQLIGAQLDTFPLEYRDIKDITAEYNTLKKNIEIIQATPAYHAWNTITEKSSTSLRNAYANLINFNTTNNAWNLTRYLDGVHDKYVLNLIFGIEWETSDGRVLYWYEDDDSQRLLTSLPSEKSHTKDYYFYVSVPNQFGYKNQYNSSDKFLAYKITEVIYSKGKWQLKIYCYSDSKTYILTP